MEETTPQNKKNHESGIGPIVGTLIIVILLLATALYIWGEHLNTAAQIQAENQKFGTTTIIIYGTSTVPADIQSDLQSSPTINNPGF